MSAEVGLVANLIFFSGIWTAVSVAVDKIIPAFNSTCGMITCFEDGISAFGMMLTFWRILLPLIWIGCLINYFVTKNNQALQNQVI
jgi:hypothetical protein